MEACCTCARLLAAIPRTAPLQPKKENEKEKSGPVLQLPDDRRLPCCGRVICGPCVYENPRFGWYCPYCQITTAAADPSPSSSPPPCASLLPQGLRDPPAYSSVTSSSTIEEKEGEDVPPPPYSPPSSFPPPNQQDSSEKVPRQQHPHPSPAPPPDDEGGEQGEKEEEEEQEDILHFLDHERDTVQSLSLRYGVPAQALRAANRLASGADHLLAGRQAVVIPRAALLLSSSPSSSFSSYPSTLTSEARPQAQRPRVVKSLSPRPVGGEAEERRKARIRRWMVACKVADYDAALLYLEAAGYDVERAVAAYRADEAWERAHPLSASSSGSSSGSNGKGKTRLRMTLRGPSFFSSPSSSSAPSSSSRS